MSKPSPNDRFPFAYLHNFKCINLTYFPRLRLQRESTVLNIDDWSMENMANKLETGRYHIRNVQLTFSHKPTCQKGISFLVSKWKFSYFYTFPFVCVQCVIHLYNKSHFSHSMCFFPCLCVSEVLS